MHRRGPEARPGPADGQPAAVERVRAVSQGLRAGPKRPPREQWSPQDNGEAPSKRYPEENVAVLRSPIFRLMKSAPNSCAAEKRL